MSIQDVRKAAWPLREPHCATCGRPKRVEDKDFWDWKRMADLELHCPKCLKEKGQKK
jgi:hypothetical protein